MLKAIIFDLNGVFITSPKLSDRFELDFGIPSSEFLPELSRIMDAVRRPGATSTFAYWKPLLEKWSISMNEKAFWKYWFEAETPSDEMIALARDLKGEGMKVITLSNNFKERAEYYAHYPWMQSVVEKAYFSWQTGFVKPDLEAWKLVLTDFQLEPQECIYFDDQEKNLIAAESLGIRSFMFESSESTRMQINNLIGAL
jgi:HAD superfamily hydrolase (TIGR01509 family)